MKETVVVKLSGKALGAVQELSDLFKSACGKRLVVVHGGGVEVDALFKDLSLEVKKIDGLRVSLPEQMPYICAALAGMCNHNLQALAIKNGLSAIGGLCSDGKTLKVSKLSERLGMVGKVEPLSADYLNSLLDNGYTPVLASLAIDDNGLMYNVNADDCAQAIALLLNAPLYFISDVPGVLDADGKVIESLDEELSAKLIASGVITEGMAVKVKNALLAAKNIKKPVYIASYKDPNLALNLFDRRRLGTAFNA